MRPNIHRKLLKKIVLQSFPTVRKMRSHCAYAQGSYFGKVTFIEDCFTNKGCFFIFIYLTFKKDFVA